MLGLQLIHAFKRGPCEPDRISRGSFENVWSQKEIYMLLEKSMYNDGEYLV